MSGSDVSRVSSRSFVLSFLYTSLLLLRVLLGVGCKAPDGLVQVLLFPGVNLCLQLWRHWARKVKVVGEYLACVVFQHFFLPLRAKYGWRRKFGEQVGRLDGTRASTRACSRFFSVFRTSSWMYGLSASSVACAGAAG